MASIGTFQVADFAIAGLGLASGGTAIAIAGVIALGAGLMKFFSDSGEAAKKAAEDAKKFKESLSSISTMKFEKAVILAGDDKDAVDPAAVLERQKFLYKQMADARTAVSILANKLKKDEIVEDETTGQKHHVMVIQETAEYLDAIQKKMKAENEFAKFMEDKKKVRVDVGKKSDDVQSQLDAGYVATLDKKNDLDLAATHKFKSAEIDLWYNAELKKAQDTLKVKSQLDERVGQLDQEATNKRNDLANQEAKARIDAYEKVVDAENTQTAAIYEFEDAQNKKAIEDAKKLAEAKAKEITDKVELINLEYDLGKLTADNAIAQLKAQEALTDNAIERAKIEKAILDIGKSEAESTKKAGEAVKETIQIAARSVDNIVNARDNSVRNDLNNEKKTRTAALETEKEKLLEHARTQKAKDKINADYAAKEDALNSELDARYKSSMQGAWLAQKTFAIAQATINTYEAAAKALTAGPILGPILAAIITAAGLADVAVIASTQPQGLAKGTRITKPTLAMIGEGNDNEYVAPEQDFMSAAKDYLIPQTLALIAKDGINVNGYRAAAAARDQASAQISTKKMENQLARLNDTISKQELTLQLDSRKLLWVVKNQDAKEAKLKI